MPYIYREYDGNVVTIEEEVASKIGNKFNAVWMRNDGTYFVTTPLEGNVCVDVNNPNAKVEFILPTYTVDEIMGAYECKVTVCYAGRGDLKTLKNNIMFILGLDTDQKTQADEILSDYASKIDDCYAYNLGRDELKNLKNNTMRILGLDPDRKIQVDLSNLHLIDRTTEDSE